MLQGNSLLALAGGMQCMTAFSNAEMNNLHFLASHNCVDEIKRLCDSSFTKNKTYDLFLKECNQKDRNGNTPAMVAALGGNREALLALLSPFSMVEECEEEELKKLLHHRNKNGQQLISLVTSQGQTLFVAHGIVIECEAIIHKWDACAFKRCIRNSLGSTNDAAKSLQMFEQIKRDEDANTFKAKALTFSRLLIRILLFRAVFLGIEIGADGALVFHYYHQWVSEGKLAGESHVENNTMRHEAVETCQRIIKDATNELNEIDTGQISFQYYHCFMSSKTNFIWTLAVMGVPFVFFFFEQLRFRLFSRSIDGQFEEIADQSYDSSNLAKITLKATKNCIKILVNILCICLWPLMSIVRLFWSTFMFETSQGEEKTGRRKDELQRIMMVRDRSHMVEICTEASLQPILQLYLVLLNLENWIQTSQVQNDESNALSNFIEHLMGENQLALISAVIAVLNIGIGYTSHYYYVKEGSLKPGAVVLYFIIVLLYVISRILSFEVFAYSLGPGNFLSTLILIVIHVAIMSVVHFKFSDSLMQCRRKKGNFTKVKS